MQTTQETMAILVERERQAFERLLVLTWAEKGIADRASVSGVERNTLEAELDRELEARLAAGNLNSGNTERERLEDEWLAAHERVRSLLGAI